MNPRFTFEAGRLAAKTGRDRNTCPFSKNNPDVSKWRNEWLRGWDEESEIYDETLKSASSVHISQKYD